MSDRKLEVVRVQHALSGGPMMPIVMGRIGEQGAGLSPEEAEKIKATASVITGTSVIVREVPEQEPNRGWKFPRLLRRR